MKKKLLAMTLAIVMLVSLVPLSALAAEPEAQLTLFTQDGAAAGSEIAVKITLAKNPGLAGLSLKLDYDDTRLEPVLNRDKTCFASLDTQRKVAVFRDWKLTEKEAVFQSTGEIFFNGDILTAAFRIRDDAPLGNARVELQAQGRQEDGTEVKIPAASVTVKVLKADAHVHDWGQGEVTKEPTCTVQGVRSYKCPDCKATRTEELPALGHNWGPWELTKEPTATAPGMETRRCLNPRCKETETREFTGQTVNLTLDAAGGTVVPENRTVIKDAPIGLLPTPTREGYAFQGWFSDPDTGSLVDGTSSFSTDATLWAHWKEARDAKSGPTLEAGTAIAAPGQEITIAIRLKDNPGLAGLAFSLDYDKKVLTYKGFRDSGLEDWMVGTHAVWTNSVDSSKNGEILLLNFLVNEDAEECTVDLNLRDVSAGNEALQAVELSLVNGRVEIRNLLPGDVDGSGTVDLMDLITLFRYVANNNTEIHKTDADVNGDGSIDINDVLALQAQLADAD